MFSINPTFIDTYRLATLPTRSVHQWWMKRTGTMPVGILFYHRISDEHPNPWTMSRQQFERQIDWFQTRFELVSLEEAQQRLRQPDNRRPTLSITFDDGYAENCEWALPMLISRRIPVTYFVTLDQVLHQCPFPYDAENGMPLPVNTLEQLRALADAGVEIGGHTRTHPDLGAIQDPEVLLDEVIEASVELGGWIGHPISYFAFPFGQLENLNPKVFQLAQAHGLKGVCSAYGGFNVPGQDPFHLKRIHGDPCLARMKNWLTYDPRRFQSPDFAYATSDVDSGSTSGGQE